MSSGGASRAAAPVEPRFHGFLPKRSKLEPFGREAGNYGTRRNAPQTDRLGHLKA